MLPIRMAQNRSQIRTLLITGKYDSPSNSNFELVDKNPETTDEKLEPLNDEKAVEVFIAHFNEEVKTKLSELEQ